MRKSILHRRKKLRIRRDFDLQLTSMMDMLIILVVFLLKSYATNSVAFATSSNINLPTSSSDEIPADSLNVIIEPSGIIFDGEKTVQFKAQPGVEEVKIENATYEIEPHLLGDSGRRILPLYDIMVKSREKTELLMSKAVWKDKDGKITPPKFHGVVVIHADKSVRYELLRKVMYTAGAAQYKIFKLVTVKKDAG